jgi:hypothetical protein
LEHGDTDKAEGNHVHEEFLVKGGGGAAMPGCGMEGVFEVPIEGFDIPSHVIEVGQFRGGEKDWVQEGGDQTSAAKTVSMNEEHADGESGVVIIVHDLAEVIPFTEATQHLGTSGFFSGNKEMCMAEEDVDEGGAVIEAVVQENQIALFYTLDELVNEFVFRGACLVVDES